jgi:hypothetical protein
MADYQQEYQYTQLAHAAEAVRYLRTVDGRERRRIREDALVSRKALEAVLKVSQGRVAAYEGGTLPSGDDAIRYACALRAMEPAPDVRLTPEERQRVLQYFESEEVCPNCRGVHTRACPRVRSVSYHDNGTLRSVEYWPDGEWPQSEVIFRDSPEMQE